MKSELGKRIAKAYYPPEEFVLCIVYAPLGYGKSAYQFKATVDVLISIYRLSEAEAWEALKSLIVFHPEQFFDRLDQIRSFGFNKTVTLNWDDAGLWLYAMDWDDPFVEAFTKWLNVARTDLNSLICSTPDPTFVFKKMRNFPAAITVNIIKTSGNPYNRWDRVARGYHHYKLPDLQRTRVRKIFEDRFSCKMPRDFYDWYKPRRDAYADVARKMMEEQWRKKKVESKVEGLPSLPNLNPRWLG